MTLVASGLAQCIASHHPVLLTLAMHEYLMLHDGSALFSVLSLQLVIGIVSCCGHVIMKMQMLAFASRSRPRSPDLRNGTCRYFILPELPSACRAGHEFLEVPTARRLYHPVARPTHLVHVWLAPLVSPVLGPFCIWLRPLHRHCCSAGAPLNGTGTVLGGAEASPLPTHAA
jgi:hypothetical protein